MSEGTTQTPLAVATASARTATELSAAGVSAIVAYHSSVYRARGIASVAGLLPWDSANRQVLRMAPGIVRAAGGTPVIATVCANDQLLHMPDVLAALAGSGVDGVLNAPTVGLLTGPVRDALELTGLGRDPEIDLIRAAHASGLRAWCYVFDQTWTELALAAGADVIVVHLGLTATPQPSDSIEVAASCLAAVDSLRPATPVYLHGGSLVEPASFARLVDQLGGADRTPPLGFFGASVFEQPGARPHAAVRQWRARLRAPAREAR